jgi:hypothetical protein
LPDLKLDAQPSEQLLMDLSSLASFPNTDSCAAVNGVVGDVWRAATLFSTRVGLCGGFAACCGLCGLATCFGAWTVMLGSEGTVVAVVVCDIAVLLKPHSRAIDEVMARGRDAFMAIHPDFRNSKTLFRANDSML